MLYMFTDAEPQDENTIMSAFRGRPLILPKRSSYSSSNGTAISNSVTAVSKLSLVELVV
jgi:hypothetical protein